MARLCLALLLLQPVALTDLAHQGGCRKASPPDQCCHAGVEPYHCHKRDKRL